MDDSVSEPSLDRVPPRPGWGAAVSITACLAPASLFVAAELCMGFLKASEALLVACQLTLVFMGVLCCAAAASLRLAQGFYLTVALLLGALGGLGFLVARVLPDAKAERLSSLAYILFDTSVEEAWEFLAYHLAWSDAWGCALFVLLVWLALRLPSVAFAAQASSRRLAIGLVLLAISAMLDLAAGQPLRWPFEPLLHARAQYRMDLAELRRASEGWVAQQVAVERPADLARGSELFVLVLGESTTRHNMQLYGYDRPTTPCLAAQRSSLLVFQDVLSPHSHTIPVLKELLTFADCEHPEAWKDSPNLLALLGEAGFTTWWLSNQQVFGRHESWTTAFAEHADRAVFRNLMRRDREAGFDGALLAPFESALEDDAAKKLVVVHLLGTHLDASRRYPPHFATFTEDSPPPRSYGRLLSQEDRRAVDAYDNAVLYNDYVVSELLRMTREAAAARQSRSAFIYVADHGEEVKHIDEFVGHTEGRASRYMFEIPMVAWLSDGLRRELEVPAEQLEARPYRTDRLIHSLLDLIEVQVDRYEASSSIFSPAFRPARREANGTDYDSWRLSAAASAGRFDPAAQLGSLRSKRWVHRTNSIEKLASLFDDYEGFEVDVVFDATQQRFDVNHPPAPSIGLDLEAYFASQSRIADKSFWLDFKNLEPGNAGAALAELERVTGRFGLRARVIVESPRAELLAKFRAAGFYTSYYLPRRKQFASAEEWIGTVRSQLAQGTVDALSTEQAQYRELRRRMPIEHDVLVWSPRRLEELATDEHVRVVLVQVQTPYDR